MVASCAGEGKRRQCNEAGCAANRKPAAPRRVCLSKMAGSRPATQMSTKTLRRAPAEEGEFGNACPDLWPRQANSCERQRRPPGLALADLMGTETVLVLNPVTLARKAVVEIIRKF